MSTGPEKIIAMDELRRAELEAKGAVRTSVRAFLGLDEADMQIIELRVRIAREVRRRRQAAKMSQKALAERMQVSQPRIPAIESGASANLETILLAFFATGGNMADLAAVVSGPANDRAAVGPIEDAAARLT